MSRFFGLLVVAGILALIAYGIHTKVITFSGVSGKAPRALCVRACAPESVVKVTAELDPMGELRSFGCECEDPDGGAL